MEIRVQGGSEGWREGELEEGRVGTREGWREGGLEVGKEGGREGGSVGGREEEGTDHFGVVKPVVGGELMSEMEPTVGEGVVQGVGIVVGGRGTPVARDT